MTIEIGSALPDATLFESTDFGDACPIRPNTVSVREAAKGKRIVIFGLPGAYTPTCSARHVPGYIEALGQLRAQGVDEVWCVSVNDGYVMAEWGRALGGIGKVRFLGDARAAFATALGLSVDLPDLGLRMKRCSLFVDDGVVKLVNVEKPGAFEVSDASTMLKQLQDLK